MKKMLILTYAVAGILLLTFCSKEKDIADGDSITGLEQVITEVEGNTITLYTAITPNNYHIRDSLVYDQTVEEYVLPYDQWDAETQSKRIDLLCSAEDVENNGDCDDCCPCTKNSDTVYNDSKNNYLYIGGIEAFEYNVLIIYDEDGEIIEQYEDYNNRFSTYVGRGIDTLDTGSPVMVQYSTGVYSLTLKLYSSSDKIDANLIKTIEAEFAIIRTPVDNEGLIVHDEGDPLIY